MQIDPRIKVARFAQLEPGDLFIYPHADGSCISMHVVDPTRDGDVVMLVLGPDFPRGMEGPGLLQAPTATVISFGKDYVLRLPSSAQVWKTALPASDIHCIAVTPEKVYIRANYDGGQQPFQPCYIDMEAGRVHATEAGPFGRPSPPPGAPAFALEWELVTIGSKPRAILSYP